MVEKKEKMEKNKKREAVLLWIESNKERIKIMRELLAEIQKNVKINKERIKKLIELSAEIQVIAEKIRKEWRK